MNKMCDYCHFECRYSGDKDICPLFEIEEDKECYDIDCEHYYDCDECVSYREGYQLN